MNCLGAWFLGGGRARYQQKSGVARRRRRVCVWPASAPSSGVQAASAFPAGTDAGTKLASSRTAASGGNRFDIASSGLYYGIHLILCHAVVIGIVPFFRDRRWAKAAACGRPPLI